MFSTDQFFKFSIPLQATSFLDPANPGPGTVTDQKEREEPELSDTHQEALPPPAAVPLLEGQGFA